MAITQRNSGPYRRLPNFGGRQIGSALGFASRFGFGQWVGPNSYRLDEYERAIDTDETVGTAVEFIRLAMLAALGPYHNETHPEVVPFVQQALNQMVGNHLSVIGEATHGALWAGFNVSEIIWRFEDKSVLIDEILAYHPRTIVFEVDEKGRLTEGNRAAFGSSYTSGIYQQPVYGYSNMGQTRIRLPLHKVYRVTHNQRYSDYYGRSAVQRVYKDWRLKDSALESWNVALDRYAMPLPYGIVPKISTGRGMIADPTSPDGQREEMLSDRLAEDFSNMEGGNGIVIEQPTPEDTIKLGTLTTGNNFGDSFSSAMEYYNSAIYRGLLLPKMMIAESAPGINGSTAATVHFDVFKMMLRALYAETVEPFAEHVIGPLLTYNFGSRIKDPGCFPMVPYDPLTAELLSRMLVQMCKTGAIDTTSRADLDEMRAKVGMSPLSTESAEKLIGINEKRIAKEVALPSAGGSKGPAGRPTGSVGPRASNGTK